MYKERKQNMKINLMYYFMVFLFLKQTESNCFNFVLNFITNKQINKCTVLAHLKNTFETIIVIFFNMNSDSTL